MEVRRAHEVAGRRGLYPDQNQVGVSTLRALQYELGPVALLVQLGAAPHATIRTPLPLALEQLAFLTKPGLESLAPTSKPLAGRRLGCGSYTSSATKCGHKHHLAVRRARDERSKADKLVASCGQIGDC